MNKETVFLDTTIRDGGYAINFQFSVSDVRRIVSSLEKSGFEYIEIGHGVGINGSNEKNGFALQTDEEYMSAARESLNQSKYGMFCIPGIARLEDVDIAVKNHIGFIRVGANANEIETMQPFIRKIKDNDILTMANVMKSYVVSIEDFGEVARKVEYYGSDVIYIVDSSGSMFPDDVKKYVDVIRNNTNLKIGFHGHNNLGMAVVNTVTAYEEGVDFIDTTLQGIGRSSGNAPAEQVLLCLKKKGYDINIDVMYMMLRSKALIHPLVHRKGINPLDAISGYSEFHSSYMRIIHKISTKYDVSPLELIVKYSEVDKVYMDEDLLEDIAKRLPKSDIATIDLDFWEY